MFRPGERVIYRNEGWFVIGKVTEVVMADGPIQAVALHPIPARKDGLVIRIPVHRCQPPLVRVSLPAAELDTVLERLGSRSLEEDTVLEDAEALFGNAYAIGNPMVQAKILQDLCAKNRAALTETEHRLWGVAYGALAFEIGAVRHLSRPKAKQVLNGILREAAHRRQESGPEA